MAKLLKSSVAASLFKTVATILSVGLALSTAACGQKGPLSLPAPAAPASAASAAR